MAQVSADADSKYEQELAKQRKKDRESGEKGLDSKFKALDYLLSQSKLYSTIMLAQMQKQEDADVKKGEREKRREEKAEEVAVEGQRRTTRGGDVTKGTEEAKGSTPTKANRRSTTKAPKLKKEDSKLTDFFKKEEVESKAGKGATVQAALKEEADGVKPGEIGVQNLRSARQPDLVCGGTMRQYQLEGLEWLTSLYENGLNGILADEMGLGKTIQTISFLAFLREKGTNGPFLIAAPLSTTGNWVNEFKKWTPDIPVVLYHGSKQERAEIRRKRLRRPGSKDFPVVCTSYEICMNDRKHLAHFGWKFIIIDEGHRIKNLNCRLMRELQSYQSANRLLITGTPLQNNLAELWSLLHFLMPEIFDKLESFESWFDFSALKEKDGFEQILNEERKKSLVTSLHAILKPFLLRRVKADVEHGMPQKREYILYAPLSTEQRELYQAILDGNSRAFLEDKFAERLDRNASGAATPNSSSRKKRKANGASSGTTTPNKSAKRSRASTPATNGSASRTRKAKKSQSYEEVSDQKYFKTLDDESSVDDDASNDDEEQTDQDMHRALAKRHIQQKKLLNPVLQLRLACNSVDLFFDRFALASDADSTVPDYTELVRASGKMQLLDRLLRALLARPEHKVLIFSQFKTQLDILALYIEEVLGAPACRIDGGVAQSERQEAIDLFNASPEHRIFLLSTRAGGQGINLAAADTVVLFDSDWNPQQDLQAQDRAHRIGQKRNVVVYRLATRGTVEEVLLEKAEGKRRLEKLVIRKGRFRSFRESQGKPRPGRKRGALDQLGDENDDGEGDAEIDEMEELRGLLGRGDGEKMEFENGKQLLSDAELELLLDRSDEAYERAEKGLDQGGKTFKAVETKRDGEGLLAAMAK